MAQQWRACAALLGTRVQFPASKLGSSQLPVTSVTEGSDISGLKSTCTHMHIPAHRHIHKILKRRYVHQDVQHPDKLLSRVWIKLLSPSLSSSFKTSIGKKAYLQFSVSLSLPLLPLFPPCRPDWSQTHSPSFSASRVLTLQALKYHSLPLFIYFWLILFSWLLTICI